MREIASRRKRPSCFAPLSGEAEKEKKMSGVDSEITVAPAAKGRYEHYHLGPIRIHHFAPGH